MSQAAEVLERSAESVVICRKFKASSGASSMEGAGDRHGKNDWKQYVNTKWVGRFHNWFENDSLGVLLYWVILSGISFSGQWLDVSCFSFMFAKVRI